MNEVHANNSHRLFVVTDVRCPWLMSVCRSQDTNVHISVLQWRRFAWDEQLPNWDNVKAEWMIKKSTSSKKPVNSGISKDSRCLNLLWQDAGKGNIWRFLPILAENQKVLFLLTLWTLPCSCNREWFEMSVNAESPSSMIQFGKNTFDHLQKLKVQNKRHGSPGVTWWRWRTWMMRCGRSFCFPSTHRGLEVASTKAFKLILLVIIPGGKRSMQTNKTGIVDITPSKWQTVAKFDSQLRNSKRHSRDTCVRVHRKDASARQLGSSLDFWWSRAETENSPSPVNLSTLKILKVQGAVAIVSKIEIWPLSSLEIDNKIKIDQVIPSVLIAKKGERELDIWCWHVDIYCSSLPKFFKTQTFWPSNICVICV